MVRLKKQRTGKRGMLSSAQMRITTLSIAVAVLASACAAPLRVERVKPADFYREQVRNALSSGDVSEFTRIVLRRHGLLDTYEEEPDQAIATLRESVVQGSGGRDEIFALAELSLFRAMRDDNKPNYMAAAVYAYAFVFPDDPREASDALDPRTRLACDIYQLALAEALEDQSDTHVILRAGSYTLPFGAIDLTFDPNTLLWHDYRLVDLTPVGQLRVEGLRNHYRTAGIGASLSAHPEPLKGRYEDDDLVGPKVRVPITVLLRIEHPERQLVTASLVGSLEVHATTNEETVRIDGRTVPLEADPTAVLATTLAAAQPWTTELAAFLGNAVKYKTRPILLRAMQPYRRGKIPVVFVHGTASSVFRWADMANDLYADERIRAAYQFWFFTYDSGNPIAYSAYRLRTLLSQQVQRYSSEAPDPALDEMVVIGHSQGGLLAKMTAIDSGDRFWQNISSKPFDEATLSPQTRALLSQALFVKPLPFVKRVIFVCTPHRGSFLAGPQIVRRLVQRLVRLPADVVSVGAELTGLSSGQDRYLSLERVPTSIDNMDPNNRFIRTLAEIPIAPEIKANSIIAVKQTENIESGDDGVVKYQSAHIDGVESELVVHDSHSTQSNPHTVAEVRRILLEHLKWVQHDLVPAPGLEPHAADASEPDAPDAGPSPHLPP
jgi:pimeloyl-ACP methyl ester carboxylesterase